MEAQGGQTLLWVVGVLFALAVLFFWISYGRSKPKPPTILICGATGVGKSTLVNVLLGRDASQVGTGVPVTQNTTYTFKHGDPFAFYDSRGLEVEEASHTYMILLSDLLRLRFAWSARRQIELVVMCIAEPSARIDDAHEEIAYLCEDLNIPLGVVLTKAQGDEAFRAIVTSTFPMALFVHPARALPLKLTKVEIPAEGIDELLALLRQHAGSDLAAARKRAVRALGAGMMAQEAAKLIGHSSDKAWVQLSGAAYRLLLNQSDKHWTQWLQEARTAAKCALVPGFFKRWLNTKFDNERIDGALARRIFPRILRAFGKHRIDLDPNAVGDVVNEALEQMREQRPFRSRL